MTHHSRQRITTSPLHGRDNRQITEFFDRTESLKVRTKSLKVLIGPSWSRSLLIKPTNRLAGEKPAKASATRFNEFNPIKSIRARTGGEAVREENLRQGCHGDVPASAVRLLPYPREG